MVVLMKFAVIAACVIAVKSAFLDANLDAEWELYVNRYNKHYKNSNETKYRRIIWEENVRYIEHHNIAADLGVYAYWLGLNQFADMSSVEFNSLMNREEVSQVSEKDFTPSTFLIPENVNIPDSVDWRKEGYVTPVKDQGRCGSCWSFSATGSLEGQYVKKTGKLVSFSEQNLIDCSTPYGNMGCNGGLVTKAFNYIKENGGLDAEICYPYTAKGEVCHFNKSCADGVVTGFVMTKKNDENELKTAVGTVGPISVSIDAGHRSFQHYKSGVYNEPNCSSTITHHAVLVVGYGVYSGDEYWLVKNSWGIGWGMDGYIMMSRNKGNQCAIAKRPVYPLV